MNTPAMFRSLLNVQWKQQRKELVVGAVAGAMIAPSSLWNAATVLADNGPLALLSVSELIGLFGSVLAILVGLLLAIRPYALDAQRRHVYPLSLPIPRSHYALLRAATGLVLILLPAAGFLIGNLVAAQVLPLQFGLRTFPVALAFRFALAAAVAFSVGFALQYGLGARAARWIVIVALTIGIAELVSGTVWGVSLTEPLWKVLTNSWSPLRVFVARWMLFDV